MKKLKFYSISLIGLLLLSIITIYGQHTLMPLPSNQYMDFSDCSATPSTPVDFPIPNPNPLITDALDDSDLELAWNTDPTIFDDSYQGQFPKFCSQLVHDERGNLLFFIIDNNVYNEYGESCIDPLSLEPLLLHDEDPLNPGNEIHRFQGDYLIVPEVSIVPKPISNPDCEFEFWVFYAIKYYDNSLGTFHFVHYVKTLLYHDATDISFVEHQVILDEIVLHNQSVKSPWQPNQLSMGISPYNDLTEEYIYVIKGDNYFVFLQVKDDISTIKLDNAKVFYEPIIPTWPVSFPELEIIKHNPPYTMTLAAAYGEFHFCVYHIPWQFNQIIGTIYNPLNVINIGVSFAGPGLIFGALPNYGGWINYNGTLYPTGNYYLGLEFSENSRYLYLTRDGFPGYQVHDLLYTINYLSPLGTYELGNSYLELGKDDEMYLAHTVSTPTTSTFSSVEGRICIIETHNIPDIPFPAPPPNSGNWFLDTDQITQTGHVARGHYGFQAISPGNYFVFPDQVDEFSFSDYYSIAGMHFVFDQFPANLSGSYTWSPGCNNNPWNSIDGHVYFTETQTIPESVDLSLINMNFHFSENSALRLEHGDINNNGAYLELNSSVLTSMEVCGTEDLWRGVVLDGNDTEQEDLLTNNQQPVIKLFNSSRIENARVGIHSFEGGIIKSTASTFFNNVNAIRFDPFQNTALNGSVNVGNISSFNKDNFYVDDNMFGYLPTIFNNFETHVKLFSVDGISFKQCTFDNQQSNSLYIQDKNIGIETKNAGLTVTCNCDIMLQPGEECPDQYKHPSVFTNLNQGIRLLDGNKFVKINESSFEENSTGINIQATKDVIIIRNDFFVGGCVISNPYLNQNIGIHSNFSTNYKIEENILELSSNALPAIKHFGIVVKESGVSYNEVYNNEILNLHTGINAVDQNREISNSFIGLQILCNKFTGLEAFDIKVDVESSGNLSGIANHQGMISNGASAGNEFTPNIGGEGNFQNNAWNLITYYFDPNLALAEPIFHTPIYVDPKISTPNTCPSQITGYPLTSSTLLTQTNSFYSARNDYYNLLYNYNQLIDGGNTPSLLIEIQNKWPQEAWDLRNDLIGISPFVSEDALREAAFTGILPDALLLEICLANPDATKNDRFIEDLEFNIPNTLPLYMIDMIRNSWSGVTTRTLLERNIASKSSEMNQLFGCVLKDIKSRDEYSNDELIQWYSERNDICDYYTISDIYIQSNNYDSAINIVNDILIYYNLEESQQIEYDNYLDYLDFRSNLYNDGKTIYELDSVDINVLLGIGEFYEGIASQHARNILCVVAGICEPCYGIIDTTQNKSDVSPIVPNNIPQYSKVSISPNPANNFTNLEWELSSIEKAVQININNSKGQIINSHKVEDIIGKLKIETSGLAEGVYYFEFISDNQILKSGKFIILH